MKKSIKKIFPVLIIIALLTIIIPSDSSRENNNHSDISNTITNTEDITIKTVTEWGNPTIAGSGSYYDDGTIYYNTTSTTIGYKIDQSKTVFEYDIIFDKIKWPAWMSFTFKASACDRTQASALEQKGYSFVFFPSGAVEVWKPDMTDITATLSESITIGMKYKIKIGAYNEGESVRLYLNVNGIDIINQLDETNPYLTGEWFNICSDGGVVARMISTKNEQFPNYNTITLSTLLEYPSTSPSGVSVDEFNNISLQSGAVGFQQYLQNYSFEFKANWSKFNSGSNVWIGMRVGGFDRANSSSLERKGYTFRLAKAGVIDVYREGLKVASGKVAFSLNTDYIIEVGTVDLDENRTQIFALVNNVPVVSYIDNEPIQKSGYLNINGDGTIDCKITSVNTKLTPLISKLTEETDKFIIETYFNNNISYTPMVYEDFTDIMLEAIMINSDSIKYLNEVYYSLDGTTVKRAVDLEYISNKLVITIYKNRYIKSNDVLSTVNVNSLIIKKTGQGSGLQCPSGFILKQTYYNYF